MGLLVQKTQFSVPAAGFSVLLGSGLRFWLSIAVDVVAGQATGTGVTVAITGKRAPQTYNVEYGSPALTIPCDANYVLVTGSGAVIELLMHTDYVVVQPVTLTAGTVAIFGNVTVQGTVGTIPNSVAYVGGASAPVTGGWLVTIKLTASAYPLINGISIEPFAQAAANFQSGNEVPFLVPVKQGTTYTVTGGTVVDGVIQVT